MSKNSAAEKIKKPILIPFSVSLLLYLAISLFLFSWLQQKNITEEVRSTINATQQLFEGTMYEEAKMIKALLNFYQADKDLQKAFLARDRQALLRYAQPIFKDIRQKYQITHFYFIEPDRTCFLRVHNPHLHGDTVNRYTLLMTAKEGGTHYGIELGAFGTLTLRVVHPWRVDGRLIGFLEFGKEIEYIIPLIRRILDVELLFAVNTKYLDRKKWEEGLRMMGRTGDWDEIPRHVIIGRTMPEIPPALIRYIALPHERKKDLIFKVATNLRQQYRGGFAPLVDASGTEIGEIIVLKDFTEVEMSLHMLSGLLVSVSLVMGGFLFAFFYGTISRIERRLVISRENLEIEIAERKKAEAQIKDSLEEKELLLREIHHRVKNNLQIVASLFRLQLRQIDDPKALAILHDSENQISAMALVHKTLYQPKSLTRIYFRDFIRELSLNLFESYGVDPERIMLKTNLVAATMDIDTVTPCGLIINELVTNALKYAFPGGRKGEVAITLEKPGGQDEFLLIVSDNGVGLPEGLDIRRSNSLGLQLVMNLTERQLRGRLEVVRKNGTEFRIWFRPLKYKQRI